MIDDPRKSPNVRADQDRLIRQHHGERALFASCAACGACFSAAHSERGFTDLAAWIDVHGGACALKAFFAARDEFTRTLAESFAPALRALDRLMPRP
jgi:hypothetical protein